MVGGRSRYSDLNIEKWFLNKPVKVFLSDYIHISLSYYCTDEHWPGYGDKNLIR